MQKKVSRDIVEKTEKFGNFSNFVLIFEYASKSNFYHFIHSKMYNNVCILLLASDLILLLNNIQKQEMLLNIGTE